MKIVKNKIFDASYFPLAFAAVITIIVVYIVYGQTQSILKERLRERIFAIVSTAALQFNSNELQEIITSQDTLAAKIAPLYEITASNFKDYEIEKFIKNNDLANTEIYRVTNKMKAIRKNNLNIKYVYFLEATDDPMMSKFITDSDTVQPVDWDANGKLDEIEVPPLPGEDYDISEIPAARDAFEGKTSIMDELYIDKWGSFLSGYAPIRDEKGTVKGVLGIDVQVDDFTKLIRATLIPFAVLALLLLLMLTIQTIALIRIWRSRVEIVEELDRQKDDLLSIVSHQLATPATSINYYLEMMQDGDIGELTKEQKEHVAGAQGIVGKLVDLIGMILDVSRIQLGKMKVQKQELDLAAFFKDLQLTIEPRAKEKSQNFQYSIPREFPKAMLDKRLMTMTLENLLSNAVKYTPEKGTVEFTVEVKGNRMYCVVKDTGVGIPEKDKPHMFDKLYRASNVRNTVEGNGFGLYVAKGAVESQGGSIRFESTEGKGTTFYVEYPLT